MNKLKIIFLTLFFFSSFYSVSAQKVDFGNEYVLINKAEWVKYYVDSSNDDALSLFNNEGAPIILIRFMKIVSEDLQSEINPEGILYYTNVRFLPLNKEFEVEENKENTLSLLFKSNVVTSNYALNTDNVNILMKKYSRLFSKK
jgi:hypothetical protein